MPKSTSRDFRIATKQIIRFSASKVLAKVLRVLQVCSRMLLVAMMLLI
jgi:hypothetical protein